MKSRTSVKGVATWCAIGLIELGCSSGASVGEGTEPKPDPTVAELIGSISASSKSLDGIGSLGFVYEYSGYGGSAGYASGGFAPIPNAAGATTGGAAQSSGGATAGSGPTQSQYNAICTGTLLSANSVLTSRVCAQSLLSPYGGTRAVFAIGAHSAQPQRLVDVVAAEYAPSIVEGGQSYDLDLAVVHLAESLSDVTPFPTGAGLFVGEPLVAVGYGVSDLRYGGETRRAGAITLRAQTGLLFPLIFNTFDAFYNYVAGNGYGSGFGGSGPYYPSASGAAAFAGSSAVAGSSPAGSPAGGSAGEWVSGFGGFAGRAGGGGQGGSGGDWYRDYLLSQYSSVALPPLTAYFGGTDADTQPCYRDEGGPILRSVQGQVRVFGVFSRTPFGTCEQGALYSTVTPRTKAWIDNAANWVDPCADTSTNGKCSGTTAVRCSTVAEGKRRLIKLDCSLLNQVCVGDGTTEVTCSDP